MRFKNFYAFLRKIIKKPIKRDFPENISLELTSLCNAKCIWCIHSKGQLNRKKFMDFDLFKKIINECKNYKVKGIYLNFYGEPLINDNLLDYLNYIKDNLKIEVYLITNAALLTEEISEKLITNNLISHINFSIDGNNRNTIKDLKGLDFNIILNNIEYFLNYHKIKESKIKTSVSFIKIKQNEKEINSFKNRWKNRVNIVLIMNDDERFTGKNIKINNSTCPYLFRDIVINSEGKVPLCCKDFSTSICLGDVKNNSIKEIWNNNKFNFIRDMHINKQRNRLNICRYCLEPI